MLDVGWTELLVIGVVALLVIGPKDLPEMFRQLGRFTAKMRGMARDFQRAMDEAAKQAGVADVAKDLRNVTSPKSMGMDAMKSAADKFEKWDPIKNAAKPSAAPAISTIKTGPLVPAPVPASLVSGGIGGADAGPATQALYEKQAAKAAAYRDYSAKLKSIDDGTLPVAPVKGNDLSKAKPAAKAKPATKPAAAKPTATKTPAAKSVTPDPQPAMAPPAAKPARRSPAKKKTETP